MSEVRISFKVIDIVLGTSILGVGDLDLTSVNAPDAAVLLIGNE